MTFPIDDAAWAAMTPAERDAASEEFFERQDARDGAGQLAAIERGAANRARIESGAATPEDIDRELDDEIGRIGEP